MRQPYLITLYILLRRVFLRHTNPQVGGEKEKHKISAHLDRDVIGALCLWLANPNSSSLLPRQRYLTKAI